MADKQPAYTGASFNAEIYKSPNESMADYMIRLSRMRSQGILGGGGMFDSGPAPTVTTPDFYSDETDLGVLKKNVRQSDSGSSGDGMPEAAPRTYSQANNFGWVDPSIASNIGGLLGPLGSLIGRGLAEWNNSSAIERAQDMVDIPKEDRASAWFKDLTDSIGTKTINDKAYDISLGGVVVDEPNFIERLFTNTQPTITTSLTPAEANRRANMSLFQSRIPAVTTTPVNDINVARTLAMNAALNQANSGSTDWGNSGYYSDSSGSYTGGSDYGGWTGVTADGSGNDWDSF